MAYRITTRDGTVFNVEDGDLTLITVYLQLEGYPPISVEPIRDLNHAEALQAPDIARTLRSRYLEYECKPPSSSPGRDD